MIITLGGKSGSGKGTVARMLSDKLGYEIIDIGNTRRALAKQMGMTILEYDSLGDLPENKEEFDLKCEEYQQGLDFNSNIILDSRLGFYNQPNAYKVFIDADDREAAKRIFGASRDTDQYDSEQEVLEATQSRNMDLQRRYLDLYDVNIFDLDNYDLLVDSTNLSPEQVFNEIYNGFVSFQQVNK